MGRLFREPLPVVQREPINEGDFDVAKGILLQLLERKCTQEQVLDQLTSNLSTKLTPQFIQTIGVWLARTTLDYKNPMRSDEISNFMAKINLALFSQNR